MIWIFHVLETAYSVRQINVNGAKNDWHQLKGFALACTFVRYLLRTCHATMDMS
jgi:hypothetical protein